MQNAKKRSVYDINIDQLKPCVIKIMITFFNYLRQTIGALREICPHSSRQVLAHTASSGWWQVRQQHADTVKRQIPNISNASFQYVCEWIYRRSIQFCCRVDWHYSRLQTRERAHDAHTHAHATVSCCWCYCEILWNVVRLEIQKVKIEITSTEFNLFCSLAHCAVLLLLFNAVFSAIARLFLIPMHLTVHCVYHPDTHIFLQIITNSFVYYSIIQITIAFPINY